MNETNENVEIDEIENVENTDKRGSGVKRVRKKEILKKRKLRKRRMLPLTQRKSWAMLRWRILFL